jgi:1,2-diacylglycerol 3-beta-galactosyltransferase
MPASFALILALLVSFAAVNLSIRRQSSKLFVPKYTTELDRSIAHKPSIGEILLEKIGCMRRKEPIRIEKVTPPKRGGPSVLWNKASELFGRNGTKKKLLILMSDTGGGHRASAQALDQALQEQYPGKIEVTVMDIWTDHGKYHFAQLVPMYRYIAKHPLLWRAFYNYGTFAPTRVFTEFQSRVLCYARFKTAIQAADPDFVVSVHPLCQQMPISIVQEMNRVRLGKPRIPFVTVVTDLGSAHPCWFDPRADAVYVPSEAVRQVALKTHMPAGKILMKGLPIRPAFWRASRSKLAVRQSLGIPQASRAVLLMGGGDGVGGLSVVATEVANKLKTLSFKTHMTVICGHNQKMKDQLTTVLSSAELPTPNLMSLCFRSIFHASRTVATSSSLGDRGELEVAVKGFVHNIDEYMAASDLLVTKAGPGTIAEAMTRGLPIVLSSFLPGQVILCESASFEQILYKNQVLATHFPTIIYRKIFFFRKREMYLMEWKENLACTRTSPKKLHRR